MQMPVPVISDGTSIQCVSDAKFSSIYTDDKLKGSKHIYVNHICDKIHKSIGIMNKVKKLLEEENIILLYYSVYPDLNY